VEALEFSTLERRIYDSIYNSIKERFDNLAAQGLLGKNYTSVLAMLMKLRRAVLHPSLVLVKQDEDTDDDPTGADGDGEVDLSVKQMIAKLANQRGTSVVGDGDEEGGRSGPTEAFAKEVLDRLELKDDEECPICLTVQENNVVIPKCMHIWFV
jgi:DNA repair protein RAD5